MNLVLDESTRDDLPYLLGAAKKGTVSLGDRQLELATHFIVEEES